MATVLPAIGLAIAGIVDKALSAVLPDPVARAKATTDILDKLGQMDLGQMQVNQEEAKSTSIFVAGWRPFIGWVCGMALAYEYVIAPFLIWGCAIYGYALPTPPTISNDLWELMLGMLGLGALRSIEKVKGVSKGLLKG